MNIIAHFSFGMWLGTIAFLPIISHQLFHRAKVANEIAHMLVISVFMGSWAIIPNFLHYVGVSGHFSQHWLMNIFLLNPLLDRIFSDGMLKGEIAMVLCFVFQYLLLLVAFRRIK